MKFSELEQIIRGKYPAGSMVVRLFDDEPQPRPDSVPEDESQGDPTQPEDKEK
jgi:hypothetical protein